MAIMLQHIMTHIDLYCFHTTKKQLNLLVAIVPLLEILTVRIRTLPAICSFLKMWKSILSLEMIIIVNIDQIEINIRFINARMFQYIKNM